MTTVKSIQRVLARVPRMLVFAVIALFFAVPFVALLLIANSSFLFEFGYAGSAGCLLWFAFCVLIFFLELITGNVTPWRSEA